MTSYNSVPSPRVGSWRASPALMGSPMAGRAGTFSPLMGSTPRRGGMGPLAHSSAISRPVDDFGPIESFHRRGSATDSFSRKSSMSQATSEHEDETLLQQKLLSRAEAAAAKGDEVLEGYLWGQIGNVAKMGVWWTIFGPLVYAVFRGSSWGVGAMRACFNIAMLLVSPLAGVLAERMSIRSILRNTTILRMIIYSVLMPGLWVILDSGWVLTHSENDGKEITFYVLFLTLVFLDGCAVSFANVVDIDCGGTDLCGRQYNAEVTDETRNRFNSLHESFFNAAIIILSPLVAFGGWISNEYLEHNDTVSLMGALGVLFLLASLYSLQCYIRHIPRKHIPAGAGDTLCCGLLPPIQEIRTVFGSTLDGFKLVWGSQAIFWRLIFLALETSFEDAMISLILVEYAANGLQSDNDSTNFVNASLISSAIVSCGKIGGMIAAILMHRFWKPPEKNADKSSYNYLFYFVFIGGICTLLIPVGAYLNKEYHLKVLSIVIVFVAAFLFFLFSTPPKIGFATLLQGLAAETDASGRIFGFVSAFLTIVDSIVLLGLSALFSALELDMALWICCGLIALHGFVEVAVGPTLVLSGLVRKNSASLHSVVGVDATEPLLNPSDDQDDGRKRLSGINS